MRCEDASSNLAAFVSGGMEPEEAAEMERHLAACSACREEREELERVHAALQAAPPPVDPPDHLKDEILSRMRAREGSESDPPAGERRSWSLRVAIAGVAAAVAVMVAVWILPDLLRGPPVATIRLVPTAEEAAELEGYWGVATLYPLPLGNRQVELRLNNFGESEPDSYYEVWFVAGDEHISAGSFTSSGEGEVRVRLNVASQASNSHTLLITEERVDEDPGPSDYVALKGRVP